MDGLPCRSAHATAVPASCTRPTEAGPPGTATPGGGLLGVCDHSHLGSNVMLPTSIKFAFPPIFPLFHFRLQKAASKEDEIRCGLINARVRWAQTSTRPPMEALGCAGREIPPGR